MPLFGPPNVQKMKAKGDVIGLRNALTTQKDSSIRRDAAMSLGEIGDGSVVESLTASLNDSAGDVRAAALDALRMLIERGETNWWAIEDCAKRYFGNAEMVEPVLIGNERAVPRIIGRLKNLKFDDIGGQAWIDIKQALVKVGKPAVEPLVATMKHENYWARKGAVEILGLIGDPRAVEPLLNVLDDRQLRSKAIEALGRIGDAQAFEPIVYALKDMSSWNRASAAEALGRLNDKRAITPLIQALFDVDSENTQDLDVREKAALALDALGWQPTIDSAGAAYWAAKHEWDKCADLGADAVEPLIYALSATGLYTKPYTMDVVRALKKLGTEIVSSRLDCINPWPPVFQSAVREQLLHYGILIAKPLGVEDEARVLNVLQNLCDAYAVNDTLRIANYEPLAREIGEDLNRIGGMKEMRRIFEKIKDMAGSRTLEMLWNGIGVWRG